MTVRKFFLSVMMVLWLGSALAVAPRALAEDPNRTTQLKISVWPEYDKPSVLVMYDGTLADGTNLPREISVLIPASASEPVTTYENNDGTYAAEQPAQSTDAGNGYRQIRYTIKSSRYHVEYYDDLLRGSPDKTLEFNFKAIAPVDAATLAVQQPLKATNFATFPAFDGSQNENGFNVYTLKRSGLTAGQILSARVTYTKGDSVPSVADTGQPWNICEHQCAGQPEQWFDRCLCRDRGRYDRRSGCDWTRGGVPEARESSGPGAGGTPCNGQTQPHGWGGAERPAQSPAAPARRQPNTAPSAVVSWGPDDGFCSKCGTKRRSIG